MSLSLYDVLLNSSFRFLSYRPRSISEIEDFLEKKRKRYLKRTQKEGEEYDEIVQKVIERLTDLSYIDDKKFAHWWVQERQQQKPRGKRRLRIEMRQKGLSAHDIEEALDMRSHEEEVALASRALRTKRNAWRTLPEREMRNKAYGFLGRLGFDSHVIALAIDEGAENDYNEPTETP